MMGSRGYAAMSAKAPLAPFAFERRPVGPSDIRMRIDFCGICHSDVGFVNNDWGWSFYPMVPGHEIVGTVTDVGNAVKKFKVGDRAAIGTIVDSCRRCTSCEAGDDHQCAEQPTPTYNGYERDGSRPTYGGYSNDYVADENYVARVPDSLDPAATAPLLCAGITVYSPLRKWGVGPGMRIGIVGIGGLGHVAVKMASAMGAEVVVFTTSPRKRDDALALGASEVVVSTDPDAVMAQAGRLDFILDTVSAKHDIRRLLQILKTNGTLCLVGAPPENLEVWGFDLIVGNKKLVGSGIGSSHELQEMLDFCGQHGIVADIEMVAMDQVNEAFARLDRNDVKYRFVIDMATLKA